jgi:hypothetical protein
MMQDGLHGLGIEVMAWFERHGALSVRSSYTLSRGGRTVRYGYVSIEGWLALACWTATLVLVVSTGGKAP